MFASYNYVFVCHDNDSTSRCCSSTSNKAVPNLGLLSSSNPGLSSEKRSRSPCPALSVAGDCRWRMCPAAVGRVVDPFVVFVGSVVLSMSVSISMSPKTRLPRLIVYEHSCVRPFVWGLLVNLQSPRKEHRSSHSPRTQCTIISLCLFLFPVVGNPPSPDSLVSDT